MQFALGSSCCLGDIWCYLLPELIASEHVAFGSCCLGCKIPTHMLPGVKSCLGCLECELSRVPVVLVASSVICLGNVLS